MSEKIFFGKQKNDDRDCCVYIDRPSFECGHYYYIPQPMGVCYSSGWNEDGEYKYDYLDTVLTEEEYNKFRQLINELDKIRGGLDKDEEKKKLADEKAQEINDFIDKYLLSEKAEKFKEKIAESEKQYMMDEYNLDENEVDDIVENYGLDYFDRGIISQVYNDSSDVAERYIEEGIYGNIDDKLTYYIDYDKLGEDIVNNDDCFYELSDGRIVEYNY